MGILRRFPNAATKTLARIACKEAPAAWGGIESARQYFRYLRGAIGEDKRQQLKDKSFYRPVGKSGDPFRKLLPGKSHFDDWSVVRIDGPCRVLVLADVHIPYHDLKALLAALRYGREHRANLILLNGDIGDFFSVSFWEKDPRKRNFQEEVVQVRSFLETVRGGFKGARIIYKLGNHEERFERYMSLKAPELLGLDDFSFERVFQLERFGIELVRDKRPIRLGNLNVIHGHEYKFNISNPVNPARGFFMRAKTHCLGSHLHQASQHSEKNIEGKVVSTWSTGCLCNMQCDYSPLNNWCHGFAFVEVDRGGSFHVENLRIIDGRIY